MPKKLKAHANERIDLGDFVRAANEYTAESVAFNVERSVLDRRSRVLDGFRVEIADQTANPGQITVYNGNAFDRDGVHLNNEDQANAAKTITLSGASQTFYIEIEFAESETDSDARAFWDPTFDQTAPTPDGQEFSINATTRISPDWQIVTPVSTTGFDAATDPNSTRIPLMVLVTDSSNEIDTTAPGSGFTQVFASTVLEEDISAGVAEIRVVDARLFPDTGSFNIDHGSGSVEGPFTLTSVDRVNGIIQFAGGPTASPHTAGAIVRMTSGTAQFVPERVTATESLSSPTQPDVSRRLYQADEVRGSALTTSKETFGDRDDTQLRSLKDHVDFLAAQLRELKFGALRPDDISEAPPSSFNTAPRYFDPAGGVQGARHHTVSIGDGTNTFGDFNGTDETPFIAAMAALPAGGGTIYIKSGSYTFGSTWTIDKNVEIIGESFGTVTLAIGAVADPLITVTSNGLRVVNMNLSQNASSTDDVISVTGDPVTLQFEQVTTTGNINVAAGLSPVSFFAHRLFLNGKTGGGSVAAIDVDPSRFLSGHIRNCNIIANAGNDALRGKFANLLIQNGTLITSNTGESCIHVLDDSQRLQLRDMRVYGTQVFTYTGTPVMDQLRLSSVKLESHSASSGTAVFEFYELQDSVIEQVMIPTGVLFFTGTTSGNPAEIFRVVNNGHDIHFRDCHVINDDVNDFVTMVDVNTTIGGGLTGEVWVENCDFRNWHKGVFQRGTGGVHVHNCYMNTSVGHDSIGVEVGTTGGGNIVHISDNVILAGFGPDAICIRLAGTGSAFFEGAITGNHLESGSTGGTTSESKGIEVEDTISGLVIANNVFKIISGAGGAQCHGVSIEAEVPSNGTLSIVDNVFQDLGGNNSTEATAIRVVAVGDLHNTTISGNVIDGVESTGNWPVIGIDVDDEIRHLHIDNNSIDNSGGDGVGIARGAIEIIQNTAGIDTDHVSICGNTIDNRDVGGNGGIHLFFANTTIVRFLTVNNNTFKASSLSQTGILLSSSSSNPLYIDAEICNNVLSDFQSTLAGPVGCIELSDANINRVNICNNVIREQTFDDSRMGIYVVAAAGGGQQLNVSNNTLVGQSGSRLAPNDGSGIYIDDIDRILVADNIVDWTAQASGSFHGIRIIDALEGVISGNYVVPDNGASAEIFADGGGTNRLYAVGNMVGNSVNNGTISLAGANSTVDAANKLS